METVQLGKTSPLPPLPRLANLHIIRFKGSRWNAEGAVKWCRMQGYVPKDIGSTSEGVQVVMSPATLFKSGKFVRVKIARDISAIVGERLTAGQRSAMPESRS